MEAKKKGLQLKVSSRNSKNSSLGSYEDDGVITWKGYVTQVEAAECSHWKKCRSTRCHHPSLLLPTLSVLTQAWTRPLEKGI